MKAAPINPISKSLRDIYITNEFIECSFFLQQKYIKKGKFNYSMELKRKKEGQKRNRPNMNVMYKLERCPHSSTHSYPSTITNLHVLRLLIFQP